MCGICGFTGNNVNQKDVLTKMMDRIVHRGPDGGGQYVDEDVALGFRRLAIIDLDNGSQPMFNENRDIVITFNGEIYNYKEIREDLIQKGHVFANHSDTECLVHGYEEYGEGLLDHLRGMFAFVIWDMRNKTLFAARDMFGIKPFYYALVGQNQTSEEKHLIFGSEIKSILEHPCYQREVNRDALEQYMTFQYSVLPETFFKGIFKLMPGHYMVGKDGTLKITR